MFTSTYDNLHTLDRFYTPAARPGVNSSKQNQQQQQQNEMQIKRELPKQEIHTQLLRMQKKRWD